MSIFLRSLAVSLFSMTAGVPAVAAEHEWNVYDNVRFGYSVCYPGDLLTAQPEADNGDGRKFTGESGAELTVWGSYNVLKQDIDALIGHLSGDGDTVTHRRVTTDWAVVSGRGKDHVFYAKLLLEGNAADGVDTVRVFRLTYPASAANTYDAVAARLAKCFKPIRRRINHGLQTGRSDEVHPPIPTLNLPTREDETRFHSTQH